MEKVTVRTYRQGDGHPKRFGAHYERANGERTIITSGEYSSSIAKEKATNAVTDCEWEEGLRHDEFYDVGSGWIDEPGLDLSPTG